MMIMVLHIRVGELLDAAGEVEQVAARVTEHARQVQMMIEEKRAHHPEQTMIMCPRFGDVVHVELRDEPYEPRPEMQG